MAETTAGQGPTPRPEPARPAVAAGREAQAVMLGDPVPLGLVAFATSVLTAGTVLAGWWPRPVVQLAVIVPLLIVFGGITQFIAAMWSYGRGQTVAGTFFGVFGSFFAAVAAYQLILQRGAVLGAATVGPSPAALGPLGVAVACFAFIALFLAIAFVSANVGLSLMSLLLGASLILLAWSFFWQGSNVLNALSGWFGIISGAVAFLTAAALSIEARAARLLAPGGVPWRPTTGRPTTA